MRKYGTDIYKYMLYISTCIDIETQKNIIKYTICIKLYISMCITTLVGGNNHTGGW